MLYSLGQLLKMQGHTGITKNQQRRWKEGSKGRTEAQRAAGQTEDKTKRQT